MVDWLRRIGLTSEASPDSRGEAAADPGRVERSTPGVAALFDGVRADETHAVLDLGAASDSSLRVYSRYARRIRFADLRPESGERHGLSAAFDAVPRQPEQPYDLLFAWDILDRLFPQQRPRLVERLVRVSAPDARLHVVLGGPERTTTRPLHFTLLDVDRLRYERAGRDRPARSPLLPAQVEELLVPFRVARGFTVQAGLREYLAVLPGSGSTRNGRQGGRRRER